MWISEARREGPGVLDNYLGPRQESGGGGQTQPVRVISLGRGASPSLGRGARYLKGGLPV